MRRLAPLPVLGLMAAAGGCAGGYGGYGDLRVRSRLALRRRPVPRPPMTSAGEATAAAGTPTPTKRGSCWMGPTEVGSPIPAPPQNPALGARPETPQQLYDPPVWHQGRWNGPTPRDNSPAVGN